jgi:hypothetical protein
MLPINCATIAWTTGNRRLRRARSLKATRKVGTDYPFNRRKYRWLKDNHDLNKCTNLLESEFKVLNSAWSIVNYAAKILAAKVLKYHSQLQGGKWFRFDNFWTGMLDEIRLNPYLHF